MRTQILLVLIFLLPSQLFAQEKGVQFDNSSSWSQIKAKAQSENKYIFLDCYTTWCGPCKMMERDIYPNDTVANFVNDHFISAKVQLDSTANDNAYVKSWYKDRKYLDKQYKIVAYPTFLFFTPEGELIMQDIGYKNVKEFMMVLQQAVDPNRKFLFAQLNDYKAGKKHYDDMANLALFAGSVAQDTALASRIAKDYMANYVNTVDYKKLFTKDNIDFAYKFYELVHPNDGLFNMIYNEPAEIDQIKWDGWSEFMLYYILKRDVVRKYFIKDRKPVYKNIDWKAYEADLQARYPKIDAHKLMIGFKQEYYIVYDTDWERWASTVDERMKDYPFKKKDSISAYTNLTLNAGIALDRCDIKPLLLRAITWVDEAIKIDGDYMLSVSLNVKANLLYKLGNKKEALLVEQHALEVAEPRDKKSLNKNYEKMKKGLKTWRDK